MNTENLLAQTEEVKASSNQSLGYEAPAIESVLTAESLEREVHYAGIQPVSGTIAVA